MRHKISYRKKKTVADINAVKMIQLIKIKTKNMKFINKTDVRPDIANQENNKKGHLN